MDGRLGRSLALPTTTSSTTDGGGVMQNSAVMTLRAAVLLACFIAVPLFAIFGKQTPEVIREFIRNITSKATKAASSPTATTNSPMFRPASGAGNSGSILPSTGAPALPANSAANGQSSATTNSPTHTSPMPAQAAPAATTPSGGATKSLPPVTQSDTAAGSVRLAGGATVGEQRTPAKQSVYEQIPGQPAVMPVSAAVGDFPAEYFREAEGKLRRMGATYYLLESLTPAGDSYRFFCKVAGSQPEAVVAFVATDSDPLRAMNTVVRQIETWRGQVQ
jgi:hypothetical protein